MGDKSIARLTEKLAEVMHTIGWHDIGWMHCQTEKIVSLKFDSVNVVHVVGQFLTVVSNPGPGKPLGTLYRCIGGLTKTPNDWTYEFILDTMKFQGPMPEQQQAVGFQMAIIVEFPFKHLKTVLRRLTEYRDTRCDLADNVPPMLVPTPSVN